MFSKPKTILSERHLLSTPDSKRGKVFGKVSITEFRRTKMLKDIAVGANEAPLEKKERLL